VTDAKLVSLIRKVENMNVTSINNGYAVSQCLLKTILFIRIFLDALLGLREIRFVKSQMIFYKEGL